MIQFPKFKYFLNPRGLGEEQLQNAPTDWRDANITYARSQKYSGLLRNFTLSLNLVKRGAFIARREFWVYLLTAYIPIRIQRRYGIFQYKDVFNGKLDFSKAEDTLTSFNIPAIPNDFSANIDAYDTVKFAIPLNIPQAINLEITPIALREEATLILGSSTDQRSDCFRDLTIANNQQNSLINSVQEIGFFADTTPDFSSSNYWFYIARVSNIVQCTGNFTGGYFGPGHYQLNFYKSDGSIVNTIYDGSGGSSEFDFTKIDASWGFTVKLNEGEKLFFYIKNLTSSDTNVGPAVLSAQINLSYQTSSPATMCHALRAKDLFPLLLQAMNANTDSGPNLPVPSQSFLLSNALNQLVYTCSDSIRAAQGSIYKSGDQLFPGIYKVIYGSISYNSSTYSLGNQFTYVQGSETFTGTGIAQKIQSISVGNVYNIGDTLQAGGTYLVGGGAGQTLTYNAITYNVGQLFKYVITVDVFTGSDDTVYAKQVAEDPQILITFSDFFQDIKAIQGGDASFGAENGLQYLETLAYVYRAGINNLSLGVVDKSTKLVPAIDLLGNTILAGYKDQQYDSLNGSQEVNSSQTYATALLTPAVTINLQAASRFDPYGIETVRITQTDSSASRSDNDNFGVWIKSDPEVAIGDFTYWHPLTTETLMINPTTGAPMITGVDPSYYNWFLSPKQNLLRGSHYLASIFYNMKGYQLTLASAVKNSGMVTTDTGGRRVAEADPINISDLTFPIFCPVYAEIKTGNPYSIIDYIDTSPYADLNFTYNGNVVKAFINNFPVQLGDNNPQSLKLLLTAENDLTKFIK